MRSLAVLGLWGLTALAGFGAHADILIGVAGPMTGKDSWPGEQMQRGAERAVVEVNAAGGVLGEQVELISADDFCDPEQATAAARKLVSQGVKFVVGHYCSGASIPASEIYEAASILMISPASSNPKLTELGRANVFRVMGRDDVDGFIGGNYLADHWATKKIAIVHDGTVYGKGLADAAREQLRKRGVAEAVYQAYEPGKNDYSAEVDTLRAADIHVLYVGGYHTEIALLLRAARDKGYQIQFVSGSGILATEEFGLIAGAASEGTLFTSFVDPRRNANATEVIERFRAEGFDPEGYTLLTYAAVQVWSQAAERAGSLELSGLIAALHNHEYKTVLGPIAFDTKGDVTTQAPVW